MAVTARIFGQSAGPRLRSGRPPAPRRRSWWAHLLGAIEWLNRTAEVIVAIERVGPYRSVEVARRWLERP